jgi:hypothetical protein
VLVRLVAIAVFAVVLSGCAKIPGNTRADAALQRDVRQTIGLTERALGGSSSPKVVDTEFIEEDGRGGWREVWVVRRGDREVRYPVKFTPAPQGGTYFNVTANAKP